MPMLRFPLVAGLAMVLTGMAAAQDAAPEAPARQRAIEDERPGQDQNQVQNRDRAAATDSQASVPLKDAIVMKLIKENKAEIELAQMAQKKVDNQQLQQLTETIISDHQALNEKLAELSPRAAAHEGSTSRTEQPVRQTTTTDEPNTGVRQAVRIEKDQPGDQAHASHGPGVPQQLLRISGKACDNAHKMTMEMLQKHEGQDFQMAFLGQQIVAHTHMLAQLQAIESEGPEELQATMKEAAQKTKDHLEQAKKLAQKFEDDRRNKQQ